MATYDTAYAPPPPPLGARQDSSADRYRPRSYSNAAPDQARPDLLGPAQQPIFYPPVAPVPQQMPQHTRQPSYGTPPGMLPGQAALPDYMMPSHLQGNDYGPRDDRERRASHSSQRSHHSHHSHRRPSYEQSGSYVSRPPNDYERRPSHHSQRSYHSHRSSHDSQRPHSRHSHRSKHFDDDAEGVEYRGPSKKIREEPRSLGNSLYAFFDVIKSALGPRDKY